MSLQYLFFSCATLDSFPDFCWFNWDTFCPSRWLEMNLSCHSRAAENTLSAAASRQLPMTNHPCTSSLLLSVQKSPPCPQHGAGCLESLLIRPRFFLCRFVSHRIFEPCLKTGRESLWSLLHPPMVNGDCSHTGSWRNLILDSRPNCIFEMVLKYCVELTRASPLIGCNRFPYCFGKNL